MTYVIFDLPVTEPLFRQGGLVRELRSHAYEPRPASLRSVMVEAATVGLDGILDPYQLGPLVLKNRVFQSAHTTNFGAKDAGPSPRHIAYHSRRAAGGVGLIVTEGIRVHAPTWRPGRLGAFDDAAIPAYQVLTDSVHAHGTAIFAQLNEPGRHLRLDRASAVSASEVPWTTGGVVPHALTRAEVREFARAWGTGAARMKDAGFDGVEVQAAHGHLINQFMSSTTNTRTDEYGGSFENRVRFAREVLDEVFESTDIPIGIRVSAEEFMPGGIHLDEALDMAEVLVREFPLTYINVTHSFYAADYSVATQVADMTWDPAPYRKNGKAYKERFPGLPIMLVCRIDDLAVGAELLRAGQADLVGMARAQIAEPAHVAKHQAGEDDTVRHCINCNQGCIGRTEHGNSITCVVNPEVGLEREWAEVPLVGARNLRKVLVVGGGPAGLEAATAAARRGHEVTLADAAERLGGAIRAASSLVGRQRFDLLVDELERDLRRESVEVRLGARVQGDPADEGFDTVVVATGSRRSRLELPGVPVVFHPEEVIDGGPLVAGSQVVVVDEDGYWAGAGLAETLAGRGFKVTWLTSTGGFAWNVTVYSRTALQKRVGDLGVKVRTYRRPLHLEGRRLVLVDTINGDEEVIDGVDAVVFSGPREAETTVARSMADSDAELWLIGDAYAPRTALEATYEGGLAGTAIGVDDMSYFARSFQAFRPPLRARGTERAVRA